MNDVTDEGTSLSEITSPRCSWLTNIQWISFNQEQDKPAPTASANSADIQSEIEHISRQLLQVKRRLGPAAERCANACNSYHGDASKGTTCRNEFEEARRACDPFAVLGEKQHNGLNNHLFMNRSAIKLANIDAALGFCLTATQSDQDTLLFADICGAPGGFSEYILWRCHTSGLVPVCRGYGMSLTGTNEHGQGLNWKLQDTIREDRWTRSQYRICHGDDGTGDIHRWENVESLQQTIFYDSSESSTENDEERGRVHLVLADGGIDAQRDVDNQEQVAQKLVVCEAAAALALLRKGGILVMKLFGFQTPVIRAVMRHFFLAFESIVAIKPISSRPASAERYVVCFGFLGNLPGWDGRKWCSQMFLGRPCSLMNHAALQDYELAEKYLFHYLDEFDRDLCSLNHKSCFSILSFLESKCKQLSLANYADQWTDRSEEMLRINTASYKIAWRLTS